jgi:hypothetical protein
MSTGAVTPLHEAWRYKILTAVGIDISGVVTDEVSALIYVPWPHIFRRAWFASQDQDDAGSSNVCKLQRALPEASPTQVSSEQWGDSSGKPYAKEFTPLSLSGAQLEVNSDAGAIYWLEFTQDNAGDAIVKPSLTLMVSPIPPGPA